MWAGDRPHHKKKGLDYYNSLKEQFENFEVANDLLLVPLLLEAVTTKTITMLIMDIKTCKLICVNREIMEESLKSFNIEAKVLAQHSNVMWDVLLQIEDAAILLAGSILTMKIVRLQTDYMGQRKTKVTLHGVPVFISENHLGFFFSKFEEVAEVMAVKSKTDIATGDVKIILTVPPKISWTYPMY